MTPVLAELAERLPWVADLAVRGAVLLAVATVVAAILRRASAAARHLVWSLALVGVLALPVLRAALPAVPVAVPRAVVSLLGGRYAEPVSRPERLAGRGPGVDASGDARSVARAATTAPTPGRAAEPASAAVSAPISQPAGDSAVEGLAGWLVLLWMAGVAALLVPLVLGEWGVRRLERRCRPVADPRVHHLAARMALRIGLRREVRLLTGPSRVMPMTFGLTRPRVVLPPELDGWPESRVEAVLLHELAHVARRDTLTQLLADVVRAIHWYDPLSWLAARRLRIERELACDDAALEAGARPSAYADELLGLARSHRRGLSGPLSAVAMARPGQLTDRLMAVLDDRRRRGGLGSRERAIARVLAVAVVAGLATMAPGLADAAPAVAPAAARVAPPPPIPGAGSADAGLAVPAPTVQEPTCAAAQDEWTSVHHQSDDDRSTIRMERPGCVIEVLMQGRVELDVEATGVAGLGPGARVRMEEDAGRVERWLEIRSDRDGQPLLEYRENGRDHPFDAGAERWYRAVLLLLFREAGFAADERVDALLRGGGVEAVMQELAVIRSSHVYARYATSLLERAELDEAETRALVRSSARRVDSDHYMAQILGAVARHQAMRGGLLDDYLAASLVLDSDHYRAQVLGTALQDGTLTDPQVEAVLRAAGEMDSDHYRAEILKRVADRYALKPSFRPAYLEATARMDSDHYRAETLKRLLGREDLSSEEKSAVLGAAAMLESDHYRTELLARVAATGLDDAVLRRAFFEGAAALESDHYYREAMVHLLDDDRLEVDLLVEVLASAAREVESDHYLSELLLRVLDRPSLDARGREAVVAAMESLESGHYRGRVAEALLRR